MELCDLCDDPMDDWMCCPKCGGLICWDCVDAVADCVCGYELDPEEEE